MRNAWNPTACALVLLAVLTLLFACTPPATGGATQFKKIQSRQSPPSFGTPAIPSPAGPPTASPTPSPLPQPAIDAPPVEVPIQTPALPPVEEAFHGVKLKPKQPVSDDDLVLAMTILKMELSVHPELKIQDISRQGTGKDAILLVETGLSTTKPVVAIINALLNRDRFEGRLAEKTLFNNNDIRFICTIPACAGVEDTSVCPRVSDSYVCTWAFGMVLWEQAAKRIGEATTSIPTRTEGNETIISEPINLYLNSQLIDYVYIPADTAGTPITDMTLTGNASGPTPQQAQQAAIEAMDRIRKKMAFKILPAEMEVIG